MTVCIAAISTFRTGNSPYIVTVSDTMVSGNIMSSDLITTKVEPFHDEWAAMMAGDDMTQCSPIIEKAREYFTSGRKNTLQVARSVFKRAFQRHVIEMREDAVLGCYGLSMEEFLKSGKRRLTENKFNSLCDRMERIEPKCEFIVHDGDSEACRSAFRTDVDHDSEVMPISVPN
jgi:hypothetical protein